MSYGSQASDRLANKTVLITGASAGIGEATAIELAHAVGSNPLKLVLAARRADRLEDLKKRIEDKYPSVKVLPLLLM